jgi:D-glycero-D-manno-heptose 1,7-bisphosphate phosphatase
VFLDRDGVLNRDRWPTVLRLRDLEMLPGAGEAVARLNEAGWPVFIVTNKTAMGWGVLSEATHRAIMDAVLEHIARAGGKVEAVYYCGHHPLARCDCHKPKPGMLLRAAREHSLDLKRSWMVGDTWRDVGAGRAAGCRTILVGKRPSEAARLGADAAATSLLEATQIILREPP